MTYDGLIASANLSLSARRAWIEMFLKRSKTMKNRVALRKESVDRNSDGVVSGSADYVSLSARRAWIEIGAKAEKTQYKAGRSPQGERG